MRALSVRGCISKNDLYLSYGLASVIVLRIPLILFLFFSCTAKAASQFKLVGNIKSWDKTTSPLYVGELKHGSDDRDRIEAIIRVRKNSTSDSLATYKVYVDCAKPVSSYFAGPKYVGDQEMDWAKRIRYLFCPNSPGHNLSVEPGGDVSNSANNEKWLKTCVSRASIRIASERVRIEQFHLSLTIPEDFFVTENSHKYLTLSRSSDIHSLACLKALQLLYGVVGYGGDIQTYSLTLERPVDIVESRRLTNSSGKEVIVFASRTGTILGIRSPENGATVYLSGYEVADEMLFGLAETIRFD